MKKNTLSNYSIIILSILITIIFSCDNDDSEFEASSVDLISGADQIAFMETMLDDKIEVVVKDKDGNAYKGATVNFDITDGSVSKATITTDSEGKANTEWTLGANDGIQTLTISCFKTDGVTHILGSPIEVTATSSPRNVSDIDGNSYEVVFIGKQIWMKENLKTTHYSNGTEIPHVPDKTEWGNLSNRDAAYSYYNNNINGEADIFGALYTWAAAMGENSSSSNENPSGIQGVCPIGWHLPSDAEWAELKDYLISNGYGYEGSGDDIGKSMASTFEWVASSTVGAVGNDMGSNNSSGFTALPGGLRGANTGAFFNIGKSGNWWSSTELDQEKAYGNEIDYQYDKSRRSNSNKKYGFSVRCIKD